MFQTTPDAGARIFAAIDAELDKVFAEARKAGRRESVGAFAVDALERLVTCGGDTQNTKRKQTTTVDVLVDYTALLNGATASGEVCEIPGLGPVPVSLVKEWLADAYLRVIVTDGIDIKAVTRKTRYVDANQRIALSVRESFRCAIEQCDADRRLELDHRVDYAKDGPTEVDNLASMRSPSRATKDSETDDSPGISSRTRLRGRRGGSARSSRRASTTCAGCAPDDLPEGGAE